MTAQANGISKIRRIHWMDNLRSIIIFLVVLYHIGGVYESAGMWGGFWIVDDPATMTWVGIVGIMFDTFVMPTMFFIAGYLTPPSLDKKTGWGFVKGKIKRLMIPWLVAVFTLIPLYRVVFLFSRGHPQENWLNYFHFNNPNSQNWLWFLPLLFVFNLIYLAVERSGIKFTKISLPCMAAISFVLSLGFSYVIGNIAGFRSWTPTPILDFENERLLQELKSQVQDAIQDIRRLVYDLRPPALDQLGLVPALREFAAQHSANGLHISVVAPETLPSLPAAVEVAAYRIALEAMTNAARHAHASQCTVRLNLENELRLEIMDNGVGLPARHSSGVGLASIRERTAELGGMFSLQSMPGVGTQLSIHLPLP